MNGDFPKRTELLEARLALAEQRSSSLEARCALIEDTLRRQAALLAHLQLEHRGTQSGLEAVQVQLQEWEDEDAT